MTGLAGGTEGWGGGAEFAWGGSAQDGEFRGHGTTVGVSSDAGPL